MLCYENCGGGKPKDKAHVNVNNAKNGIWKMEEHAT